MTNAKEDDKISSQCSHEKISFFREVTRLLLNPGKKKAKDVIREMETKLEFKRGYLELQQPHNADQRLWELALVHVLSDKEHFVYPVPVSWTRSWMASLFLNCKTIKTFCIRFLPTFQRSVLVIPTK